MQWGVSTILALALAIGSLVAPAAAPAASGPVAAYGFEDTVAGFAGDSTVNGNAGVLEGPTKVSGRYGSGLSFDGVDDRVRVTDSPSLDLTTGMTIEAWVKPTATAGWRTVLMKEQGNDLAYALYGSGTNTPSGYVTTVSGLGSTQASSALAVNGWTHLAVTKDVGTLRLYVDGVQAASSSRSGSIVTGDGSMSIGGNEVWGEWFAGAIDEVRVYDRALSAAEIQADMSTPVGDPVATAPERAPDRIGSWSPPSTWPLVAVHASMLSNGKVAVWDAFGAAVNSERLWNPETGQFEATPSGVNLFCAGHVLLPDGRLFVAGGHEAGYLGLRVTRLLNPFSRAWSAGPDMARARWYPTTTTLPDGRVLIVSGDNITVGGPFTPFYAKSDTLPEIYDPKSNSVKAMPSAARPMPLYPFMFVTPDGRVVDAGPDTTTRILNTDTGQWATLAGQSPIDGHSAVMYRPGKVLKTGKWTETEFQGVPIHNRSAVLELAQTVPSWRETAPMKRARTFHTLTVLPDGDVLALGGQNVSGANELPHSAVLEPEIWDPDTDTWTSMASSVRPRGYHTTALLLPDARVLLAGSGRLDGSLMVNEESAEIFSPPYLHKGPRPEIDYAPSAMDYGRSFRVGTAHADRIARVSLVRMGSVTHSLNMDQRWQDLPFTRAGDGIDVTAPGSPNDAPPGVYYVFLIDDKGVPSKAAILSVTNHADTVAPSVPQGVGASGGLGRVSLSWSASSDNVGVARYVVYRSQTQGFVPGSASRVATVSSGTSFEDTGLAAGAYFYRVTAEDQAGNASAPSAEVTGAALADTTAPSVSLTAPAAGSTVRGTVSVAAGASDDVGVTGVQLRLDGADLGAEDTSAPYSVSWDTTTAAPGAHTLSAIARDAAGNRTTATAVAVTVDNSAPPGPAPVAAYSFEDGAGSTLSDVTGKGHTGTIREATWTTTGKYGRALRFDGVNDWVTIADAPDLRATTNLTLEAWVNPTSTTGWRTAILKETANDLAYALYSSGSARPSAWMATTGGTGSATASSTIPANTWTHLAATYDATTIRLYRNGTQVASAPRTNPLITSTNPLRLGGNTIWGEWFAGQLDDVRIYTHTLTAAQIQTDMNTPAG